MNKTALKNFATSARKELLEKVETRAFKLGITADAIKKAEIESSDAIILDGEPLDHAQKVQRDKLIDRIKEIGFDRVKEEVAYTWFNRLTALRFMEVNDYLPTRVRVLSAADVDSAEPEMIKEALSLDLDLDKEHVYKLKMDNDTEELFKYLVIKHCNDLNRYMPFMFETIDDYTEILFPDGLLATDSFVREMTDTDVIPEDDWRKIEVIGWLYQFYIAEEKDRVFKAKKKYKAEEIPYATQLFTPDWIVRYMVQNSLGRYWVEAHPEHRDLLENWEFYMQHPERDAELEEKLAPYINKQLNVEDIKCFDPAMGSGHILVYMFDVLYEIYSKCGYMEREIPRLIIENNLYGLDIDDRAYQLACFSVVMKAMAYNKRFLRSIARHGLTLNLASIQETNVLTDEDIAYIAGEDQGTNFEQTKAFIDQFRDGKTIGSLIKVEHFPREFLKERMDSIKTDQVTDLFATARRERTLPLLSQLMKQASIMSGRYDVLVTNPPYMGSRSMNAVLSGFLKKNYPDSKSDLFASFMELDHYLGNGSLFSIINQHSWMFLSSFAKLRESVVRDKLIDSMLHLGPRAFDEISGEVVQTTAFVLRNYHITEMKGSYVRLTDVKSPREKKEKTLEAVQYSSVSHRFSFDQNKSVNIPGFRIAYWVNEKIIEKFDQSKSIDDYSDYTGAQHKTANNEKYLRYHWEINNREVGRGKRWVLFVKGGEFRKWYGNLQYVVDWSEAARNFYSENPTSNLLDRKYWYLEGITYTELTMRGFNCRYMPEGCIFSIAGPGITRVSKLHYFIAFLNSKVANEFLNIFNPTYHANVQDVKNIPVIFPEDEVCVSELEKYADENIRIAKQDWDSVETSIDFLTHPFMIYSDSSRTIKDMSEEWIKNVNNQFMRLKNNEETINEFFIELYQFEDVLNPKIKESDVPVTIPTQLEQIKSFLSYAIGCAFGRYSLDEEGLIYAGGEFDPSRYKTFRADEDNILPILPGAYFEDDIVSRFVEFVQVTFGEETLEENLDFIADALKRRKGETARETIRRYFMNDFFKDHAQTYKKRPIYWLFTSGKEKAFNCLIYMHRYDKSTLSRIRTDYLHEYQVRLDAEKQDLLDTIEGESTAREISKAKKELKSLEKKIDELKAYDELLHNMADQQIEIDLDDGVKVNYAKFKGLVAKI
ncbi:BREX-1 system adenine-specific DNA-methyltransferase PglX [Numidum massiliense]|uniref:BREX-1 system adenine-specific DNA-methyltransferase PglX n=1 Tax=Numidum massiliense TaxID=1522315 RepID=UPI0006D54CC6|nr:BREX-1 system adenine-specific DNA-methyltransferase PglX [Numidum massiliense]